MAHVGADNIPFWRVAGTAIVVALDALFWLLLCILPTEFLPRLFGWNWEGFSLVEQVKQLFADRPTSIYLGVSGLVVAFFAYRGSSFVFDEEREKDLFSSRRMPREWMLWNLRSYSWIPVAVLTAFFVSDYLLESQHLVSTAVVTSVAAWLVWIKKQGII